MGAGGLMLAGGGLGLASSFMQYRTTVGALKDQSAMAMQSANIQAGILRQQGAMSMMQSQMMASQAGGFMQSSAAYERQSGMFMDQAAWSDRMGKILAAQDYARARQTEKDAERAALVAGEVRRQKIGQGIASFAGHGVSVDASTAVQIWEQDEIADLAFELNNVKEKRDNEVWGYVWDANTKQMQGLFEAQSFAIQAQGAMINAGAEKMKASQSEGQAGIYAMQAGIFGQQANGAILAGRAQVSQNNAARQNALWGLIGGIGGSAMSIGSFGAQGGFGGGGGGGGGGYGDYSLLTGTR